MISIETSYGELIDKITILEIKSERMTDSEKLRNVRLELETLQKTWKNAVTSDGVLAGLVQELKSVNESLWDIEDDIRNCERNNDFSTRFIELARAVYITNDRRAALKKDINITLGSRLIEEKSYQSY